MFMWDRYWMRFSETMLSRSELKGSGLSTRAFSGAPATAVLVLVVLAAASPPFWLCHKLHSRFGAWKIYLNLTVRKICG
jgi:hypothetical protein